MLDTSDFTLTCL